MTGKRDRNKNTFFGIDRAVKNPARWSNKWMSQTMRIMNTTAKGGIGTGRSLRANPKYIAKPVSQFPQGSFELMQYAFQSHRDVSGVNVEILGMQCSAGQAAPGGRHRKQATLQTVGSVLPEPLQASWPILSTQIGRLRNGHPWKASRE